MVAPSRDDRSVDALVKSKAVLDVLAELGPSTAKTISERTGEPVSSTYRLLDNLAAVGWVERGINRGEYRLGIDCVRIGGQIESRLDIQQIARRTFRAHRGQFGIWGLFVRRRLRTVCIETRTREALQSYAQLVGNSLPLSMSAPSHVLTAWLPRLATSSCWNTMPITTSSAAHSPRCIPQQWDRLVIYVNAASPMMSARPWPAP